MLDRYWKERPLTCIMIGSAFFRLLAVIFSKGFAFQDDHFLMIEPAQSWVDGLSNGWLPSLAGSVTPVATGHSLLYPGLHYFLFTVLQFFGIYDPQNKMFVVRLLHAGLSLSIVYFGYKIALKTGGLKAAKTAGILLGLLFFMPMMSVRNLVEFVCIPPLMYATWLIIKNERTTESETKPVFSPSHFLTFSPFLLAGLMLGLAFSIRFQTALFISGFGLALLLQKQWKATVVVAIGVLVSIGIVQAATDMIIWHRPFVELQEYVRFNSTHSGNFITGSWYKYLLLISGILIPPISLFILFGFLYSAWSLFVRTNHKLPTPNSKRLTPNSKLLLFLPAFIFFVFHSSFPNKQERFILPAIPFIIVLGSIGWNEFMETSAFWISRKKLYHSCWIFFWAINIIPLFFVSTAYSHRSRVESMVYLSHKDDFKNVIVEESNHDSYSLPPLFYLRHWLFHTLYVTQTFTLDSLTLKIKSIAPDPQPNYVIFNQADQVEQRIKNFKTAFPNIKYETTIEPGLVDEVMHWLNPNNANYTAYIYRIEKKD